MKKMLIVLIAFAFTSTSSIAGPKIEVLHWWTSGGEAAALKVLKDDFAANGGESVSYTHLTLPTICSV